MMAMDRATKILLQLGFLAVILAALIYKPFELDRYFVPKELVLHVVALVSAVTLFASRRRVSLGVVDVCLIAFLALSAISAVFATNYWLAQRALGLSFSSALVFWASRRIARGGGARGLLIAAAVATVAAAASALLQAYGIETELFTSARAPGGTLGNRNFIAHISAIGLPALMWCTVTARRRAGALLGSLGVGLVGAALFLSRSRGAWLALLASILILAILLLLSRKYWSREIVAGRLARIVLAGAIGAILSVALPNTLHWNSDSPYLDSAKGVVDYRKGSGGGRIAQYRNSLKIVEAHPLLGVGPGNWPVRYVQYAPGGDKSLTDDRTTANPWPSSDWVAFASERGLAATVALLGVFGALFLGSLLRWRDDANGDVVLLKIALSATVTAAIVVSCFDAALLLAAPAFLVWGILGAASGGSGRPARGREVDLSGTEWKVLAAATLIIVAGSVARSATETAAMSIIGRGGQTANWVSGARWDPGSYRINARVAELLSGHGRCAQARPFARQANKLFPSAYIPRRVLRRCG
ncbi:MAG: O-antigen ligase family protein [Gemmatimonadaceae bacterium]